MSHAHGFAAHSASTLLAPFSFARRHPREHDVALDIEFCGVCHSDIHQARDEWKNSKYPMVPGHEIVGTVTAVGSAVTRFRPGQRVAVGVIVESCRACENCLAGEEQYCVKGPVDTYNAIAYDGSPTYGGYSDHIVTDQHFVHALPAALDPAAAAPLLCAGITVYSPLRHWNVGKGKKVGIVGLGGLGHLGLRFAHAFGAHTVQFTTSEGKREDALRLGADEVVLSNRHDHMAAHKGSFDFILDTVSAPHDMNAYLHLLRRNGTLCQVGIPEEPSSIETFALLSNRRSFSGSGIGGMQETQQMLDFCAEHGIVSDIEIIPIQQINEAYERILRSDVKYRFVIDMASLQNK